MTKAGEGPLVTRRGCWGLSDHKHLGEVDSREGMERARRNPPLSHGPEHFKPALLVRLGGKNLTLTEACSSSSECEMHPGRWPASSPPTDVPSPQRCLGLPAPLAWGCR